MKAFHTATLIIALLAVTAVPLKSSAQDSSAIRQARPSGSTDTSALLDWTSTAYLAGRLDGATPEIVRLEKLVSFAMVVSLINIAINAFVVVLLLGLRRRAPVGAGHGEKVGEAVEPPAPRPATTEEPVLVDPPVDTQDPDLLETPPAEPVRGRVEPLLKRVEPPQPSPSESDELASLPHAAVGRALSQLHQALPALARTIGDPRQQQRFLAELDLPLKARIERFKEATRRGDAYLREHWIEQDLVTTLNTLAQILSSAIEERHRGRRGNKILEEELSKWLYEKLAPVCQAEGWFAVELILPFMTRFDPKIHHSVGSVALDGADNLIVTIKAIGRRDAGRGFVTHKAEVIVGR